MLLGKSQGCLQGVGNKVDSTEKPGWGHYKLTRTNLLPVTEQWVFVTVLILENSEWVELRLSHLQGGACFALSLCEGNPQYSLFCIRSTTV